jgi:CheY-like chemotaxis protein
VPLKAEENSIMIVDPTENNGSRKALVVDDEESVADILSQMILFMGFNVTVAGSGREALRLIKRDSFDVLLTDLDMPGMDGWTLARHAKETSPRTLVILVTGNGKQSVLEKMKDSWVDLALFKPFRFKDIEKAIQEMLNAQGGVSK